MIVAQYVCLLFYSMNARVSETRLTQCKSQLKSISVLNSKYTLLDFSPTPSFLSTSSQKFKHVILIETLPILLV
jgi:hypothetical protein